MLISHSKKFIFIHVYKVAGTSIRTALAPYCKLNFQQRLSHKLTGTPFSSHDFQHHVKAFEIRNKILPTQFDSYYKFAFVRNPWDWQVSLYHFTQQNTEHFQHELVKKMSFKNYIEWRVNEAKCSQKEFLFDDEGNQLVNYIGRIETIEEDFKLITRKIGINTPLQHTNKSQHKDYRFEYNDHTAELIKNSYKDEIELFGYTFNGIKK